MRHRRPRPALCCAPFREAQPEPNHDTGRRDGQVHVQRDEQSSNHASWIAKLQRINPVSLASSHHTEIYFTQPKDSEVEAMLWPHVTFVSSSGTTHWYLTNSGGKYGVERHDYRVAAHPNEATIAQNVIDDAVALTWIKAASRQPRSRTLSGFQSHAPSRSEGANAASRACRPRWQ